MRSMPSIAPMSPTDEDLVGRLHDEDESAWEELLDRYSATLRRQAAWLAQHAEGLTNEEGEDEVSEIYLFLAERVRSSLASFEGRCQVRTWIHTVIGNRSHMLKAWLMRKDPARADVRLPVILRDRPAEEHEIFRRLVWGLEPRHIALELHLPEGRCFDVEEMIEQHSPRVASRIRANRIARGAPVRLDDEENTDTQLPHPSADPARQMEQDELMDAVSNGLEQSLADLPRAERRLLYMLYDQDLSVAEVVALSAGSGPDMPDFDDANRCYYLKDRSLQRIADTIVDGLRAAGYETPALDRRAILRCVGEVLQRRGVPMADSNSDSSVSLST